MAQPTPYNRAFNFSDFQSENPANPLPGVRVDEELSRIKLTTDQIRAALRLLQRDDTALANKSVGIDQLKAEVQIGVNPPTAWATEKNYVARDTVFESSNFYLCEVSHVSGVFNEDLLAGKWTKIASFEAATSAGSVSFNDAASDLGAATAQAAIDALKALHDALDAALSPAVAANTAARHTHSNKTVLDAIEQAFTTALKAKLDGIAAGAQVNLPIGTTAGTVAAGDDSRIDGALQRNGGAMTGDFTLNGDPTTALMAATKQYADSRGAPDAIIEDQKTAGTPGGTFSTGAWRTRDINTKVRDPKSLVSVASNQFVPAVSGWVEWQTTVGVVQNNTTRLQNITDGTTAGYGMSSRKVDDATNVMVCGGAPVVAGKTYELQHQCAQSKTTDGFGIPGTFGTEVYTRISFWRS
jgi:hypothetical protein